MAMRQLTADDFPVLSFADRIEAMRAGRDDAAEMARRQRLVDLEKRKASINALAMPYMAETESQVAGMPTTYGEQMPGTQGVDAVAPVMSGDYSPREATMALRNNYLAAQSAYDAENAQAGMGAPPSLRGNTNVARGYNEGTDMRVDRERRDLLAAELARAPVGQSPMDAGTPAVPGTTPYTAQVPYSQDEMEARRATLTAERDAKYRQMVGEKFPMPKVQSYGEAMAQDAWTKQQLQNFATSYNPVLTVATATKNTELKNMVADIAMKSGVPDLMWSGEALKRTRYEGDAEVTAFNFSDTEEGRKNLDNFWKLKGPQMEAKGLTKESLLGRHYDITQKDKRVTDVKEIKDTAKQGKPVPVDRPIDTQAQVDAIMADASIPYEDKEGLAPVPGSVFRRQKFGTGKDAVYSGGQIVKSGAAKEKESKSTWSMTAADLDEVAKLAPAGPEGDALRQDIDAARRRIPLLPKGTTPPLMDLMRGANGVPKRLMPQSEKSLPGAGRAGSGGVDDGQWFLPWNDKSGKLGPMFNKPTGEVEFANKFNRVVAAMSSGRGNPYGVLGVGTSKDFAKLRSEYEGRFSDFAATFGIGQADFTTAAGAKAAVKSMLQMRAIMRANAALAEQGFSRIEALRKEGRVSELGFPGLNAAVNKWKTWTGDEYPPVIEGVMAETLMDYAKVVAGQTGVAGATRHAADLAQGLLALEDNPAAFSSKLREYRNLVGTRLKTLDEAVKGYGEDTDVAKKAGLSVKPRTEEDLIRGLMERNKKTREQVLSDPEYPGIKAVYFPIGGK